ncbi:MAG TPA: N-acetylglucosamine-6-phosphate deacetylase [Anaerolineales bacterium]|nr:N-acetylglucosamine-6-phosphate deacetylase [Anaerolineales bacterium]
MRIMITGGALLTPDRTMPETTLLVEGTTITALVPGAPPVAPGDQVIDAHGMWVAPGLIDLHVHGSAGHDTLDATPEALHGMARFFARHGVTGYLATTPAASSRALAKAVANVATTPQPEDGAQHLGIHLEGPYLNPEHKGAQPPEQLRDPDPADYEPWLTSEVVRLMTVAPERPGMLALIERGVAKGIEFAVGHSAASYEEMLAAADRGLRQAAHTFNAMLGLHHRQPGTAGAVLADDRIYAQIIADGVHVHPALVKILIRAKGPRRTILITDATRAAGLADGDYELAGHPILVRVGIARTPAGSLAGSTITLDVALRNAIRFTGASLNDALRMATATPAEAMGWGGRKGVLAPGADADIILLDAELNVRLTLVAGRVVFRSSEVHRGGVGRLASRPSTV